MLILQKIDYKVSRSDFKKGLVILAALWQKDLLPKDLIKHRILTLFCLCNGNSSELSKVIGVRRNTIRIWYINYFGKSRLIDLRKQWQTILNSKKDNSFPRKVLALYRKNVGKPNFNSLQNSGLINLWVRGINPKLLRAHYFFWAFENGHSLEDIRKKFKVSTKTVLRIRAFN